MHLCSSTQSKLFGSQKCSKTEYKLLPPNAFEKFLYKFLFSFFRAQLHYSYGPHSTQDVVSFSQSYNLLGLISHLLKTTMMTTNVYLWRQSSQPLLPCAPLMILILAPTKRAKPKADQSCLLAHCQGLSLCRASWWCPHTSSISITWELVWNAHSRAPSLSHIIKYSGGGAQLTKWPRPSSLRSIVAWQEWSIHQCLYTQSLQVAVKAGWKDRSRKQVEFQNLPAW